ncbi:MAG: enhanced serine sensitivity protein SseB C-terminal domain-containing protein [Pseudolysinimonas sp.]
MTFPGNELETVLVAASLNETTALSFVDLLFRSTAFFPMTEGEEGGASLTLVAIDQTDFVAVFTSQGEADAVMPGSAFVEAPVREFMKGVPTHLGLAVNPSGTLGLPIYAEAVQHQLHRATTISAGTRVRLGEPAVEPTELLAAIGAGLGTVPAVRAARRVWAQVGERAPGLVVGLDIDPDNPDVREIAVSAVGTAHRSVQSNFAVDVVFTHDRNDFTEWMSANAAPFYPAG